MRELYGKRVGPNVTITRVIDLSVHYFPVAWVGLTVEPLREYTAMLAAPQAMPRVLSGERS